MSQSNRFPEGMTAFNGPGNLPMLRLKNRFGEARVSLQGAQVLDYTPAGQQPLLWLSRSSRFASGAAIRGGIPICWPWFGDHPENASLPAHGFARTSLWQLTSSAANSERSEVTLTLKDSEATRRLWPFAFGLRLEVVLEQTLRLTLTTHNRDSQPFVVSEALHSYLHVGDSATLCVTGLDNSRYLDKLAALAEGEQQGMLIPAPPLDRVFLDSEGSIQVDDTGLQRRILVSKQGSRSTVIWNPGQEKARSLADFDDQGYRKMLCVEAANALSNRLSVPPGGSHSLSTTLQSHPLV